MINFEDLVSKNQELTFKYLRRSKEKLGFYTEEGLYRIDNRDYPIYILYEILLTCIIFRDYSFSNANCIFKFYEDRAEFVTAGSVETCRNPKLLNVLKELKLYNDEKTYEGKVELVQTNNSFRFILPNSNYLKVDN